jgi:hypothetical protein
MSSEPNNEYSAVDEDKLIDAVLKEAIYGLDASCVAISVIPLDYTKVARCMIGVRDANLSGGQIKPVTTLTSFHSHEIVELLRLLLDMQQRLFAMLQHGCRYKLSELAKEQHSCELATAQELRKEIEKKHEQARAGEQTNAKTESSSKNN